MTSIPHIEPELDELIEDPELEKNLNRKDAKMRQKYEARKRIDELLEQKRLRQLLDDWELTDD
ncbi:hypothetical protein GCM10010919_18420 [Alishewanella longhuensis]|uniref:Uncharacterized protein n=1 Tax=Alishewanella longhuensis TaxID=1091037 RepID=A0ABQ3L6Q1_9ALTE|nr:hypothetical protein [Alishewanella longhuensis]GHG68941.1 hypothetical protein GCM10010919_18420 [Alishewanella longhuensis]